MEDTALINIDIDREVLDFLFCGIPGTICIETIVFFPLNDCVP
jgi:hypothetical protein